MVRHYSTLYIIERQEGSLGFVTRLLNLDELFTNRGLAIDKTLVSILFDIEIVLWFMRRLPFIRNNFYVIAKLFEEKRTTSIGSL
jgi:hypothetical protein